MALCVYAQWTETAPAPAPEATSFLADGCIVCVFVGFAFWYAIDLLVFTMFLGSNISQFNKTYR